MVAIKSMKAKLMDKVRELVEAENERQKQDRNTRTTQNAQNQSNTQTRVVQTNSGASLGSGTSMDSGSSVEVPFGGSPGVSQNAK